MQPNLIKSTAESSLSLLGERGHGTPEALLLAWVAWEGLKVRLMVVGLTMQGWQVQDIYEVLSAEQVHTRDHVRGILYSLFGSFPENTKGIGTTWAQIEQFREVRNRFVHGTRSAAPLRLEAGTHLITDHVLNTEWLHNASIRIDGSRIALGDPYRRLTGRRNGLRGKASLISLIRETKRKP